MLRFMSNQLIASTKNLLQGPKLVQIDSLVVNSKLNGKWTEHIEEQRFIIDPRIGFERGLILKVGDSAQTFWTSNIQEVSSNSYDFTHIIRSGGGMVLAGHYIEYDINGKAIGLIKSDMKRYDIFLLTNSSKQLVA